MGQWVLTTGQKLLSCFSISGRVNVSSKNKETTSYFRLKSDRQEKTVCYAFLVLDSHDSDELSLAVSHTTVSIPDSNPCHSSLLPNKRRLIVKIFNSC